MSGWWAETVSAPGPQRFQSGGVCTLRDGPHAIIFAAERPENVMLTSVEDLPDGPHSFGIYQTAEPLDRYTCIDGPERGTRRSFEGPVRAGWCVVVGESVYIVQANGNLRYWGTP